MGFCGGRLSSWGSIVLAVLCGLVVACGSGNSTTAGGGGGGDSGLDDGSTDATGAGDSHGQGDGTVGGSDGSGGDAGDSGKGAGDGGTGDGGSRDGATGDGAGGDGATTGDGSANDGASTDGAGAGDGAGSSDGAGTGDSASCGATGESCCSDGGCAGGALCVSGTCGTCGGPGLPCCAGPTGCSAGATCNSGVCVQCGGLGELCCGGSCSAGFACAATGTCAACGGVGEPCCAGGVCTGGGACNGTTGVCECGGAGEPCCGGVGGTCAGTAICTPGGTCSSCGAAGQGCCSGGGCLDMNTCVGGLCHAPTACTDETQCTALSPTARCGGPSTCAGSLCFVCFTPLSGATGGGGATCMDSNACSTGLCDTARGECTAPCDDTSPTRDADCVSFLGAGTVCTEETVTIGMTTGALGYCAFACARNADCTIAGDVCQAWSNSAANRVDLACGPVPPGSSSFGSACTGGGTCPNGVCFPAPTNECTRPCVTAADCAAPLPNCTPILYTLPGGGTQASSVCGP